MTVGDSTTVGAAVGAGAAVDAAAVRDGAGEVGVGEEDCEGAGCVRVAVCGRLRFPAGVSEGEIRDGCKVAWEIVISGGGSVFTCAVEQPAKNKVIKNPAQKSEI